MTASIRRSLYMLLAAILLFPLAVSPSNAVASVAGNTYTSPSYGYTITWSSAWFFIDEMTEEGTDALFLSDGLSTAAFWGAPPVVQDLELELNLNIAMWGSFDDVTDYQPLLDDQGAPVREFDGTRATATYVSSMVLGDGSSVEVITRFDVQYLEADIALAAIFIVPRVAYAGYDVAWDELLTGVAPVGGQTEPLPDPGAEPEPEPVNEPGGTTTLAGRPGPVVVHDQWRIAIAGAAIGAEIPSLALEAKDGNEWVALIADVTNWSDVDGEFSLKEPLIRSAEMDEAHDLAASPTRQVARLMAFSEQGNFSIEIGAGVTSRLVLVFSIPAGGSGHQLILGDHSLRIDDTLDIAFEPASLSGVTAIPELEQGTITGPQPGSRFSVQIGGEQKDISLIGVDIPGTGSCYSLQAMADVNSYFGAEVLLESDPAVTDAGYRYVWIVNPDGTKTLLNQLLIESGSARVTALPATARFAAWLQATEETAQQSGAGLWSVCGA